MDCGDIFVTGSSRKVPSPLDSFDIHRTWPPASDLVIFQSPTLQAELTDRTVFHPHICLVEKTKVKNRTFACPHTSPPRRGRVRIGAASLPADGELGPIDLHRQHIQHLHAIPVSQCAPPLIQVINLLPLKND